MIVNIGNKRGMRLITLSAGSLWQPGPTGLGIRLLRNPSARMGHP